MSVLPICNRALSLCSFVRTDTIHLVIMYGAASSTQIVEHQLMEVLCYSVLVVHIDISIHTLLSAANLREVYIAVFLQDTTVRMYRAAGSPQIVD